MDKLQQSQIGGESTYRGLGYQQKVIAYFATQMLKKEVKSTNRNKLSNKEVIDSIKLFILNSLQEKPENIKKFILLSNANIGGFTKECLRIFIL